MILNFWNFSVPHVVGRKSKCRWNPSSISQSKQLTTEYLLYFSGITNPQTWYFGLSFCRVNPKLKLCIKLDDSFLLKDFPRLFHHRATLAFAVCGVLRYEFFFALLYSAGSGVLRRPMFIGLPTCTLISYRHLLCWLCVWCHFLYLLSYRGLCMHQERRFASVWSSLKKYAVILLWRVLTWRANIHQTCLPSWRGTIEWMNVVKCLKSRRLPWTRGASARNEQIVVLVKMAHGDMRQTAAPPQWHVLHPRNTWFKPFLRAQSWVAVRLSCHAAKTYRYRDIFGGLSCTTWARHAW